jgi:hypothetical protein
MSEYIEVELTLDAHDLIVIESLVNERLKELKKFRDEADGWIHQRLADEQIGNYRGLLKKIKAARQHVKEVKAESDARYFASLKARRTKTK